MANYIPPEFISEVLTRVDIIEVIDSRVPLQKRSGNNYVACCPFHNEKTPSFTVSPTKQFYHCFGCSAHGNAISFLIEYERLSFVEAVETLCQLVGLSLPENATGPVHNTKQYENAYKLMSTVNRYYQQQLLQHNDARQVNHYLQQRGLTKEIIEKFSIGFAPSGWHNLENLFKNNTNVRKLLVETGMLIEKEHKHYDRFRNRIMFPIHNRRGHIIGFGGRVFVAEDNPKYLNSPETMIFHKGKELYGLYEVLQENRRVDHFLIVEGYMDVVALAQHGITNAVASLGTAISKEHLQTLLRYAPDLIFCFDGDAAGKQAAWRGLDIILPLLKDSYRIRFMFLAEGEDPDSLVRKLGKDKFTELLQSATSLADFLFNELTRGIDANDPAAKAQLKEKAKPFINKIPAGIYRELLMQRLAKIIRIAPERLNAIIMDKNVGATTASTKTTQSSKFKITPMHVSLILLLQNPALIVQLPAAFSAEELTLPGHTQLAQLISLLKTNQISQLTTGAVLEYWRDQDDYKTMSKLASRQLPIPENGVTTEFLDSINRLQDMQREVNIEQLINKASFSGLSPEEKINLQNLILKKVPEKEAK